jgi:hypothetical protein
MANKFNREAHNYRLSYQQEVGSSLDPDMEDVTRWEQEAYGTFLIFRTCPDVS